MLHEIKVFRAAGLTLQPFTEDLDPYEEIIIKSRIKIFSNSEVNKYNSNRQVYSFEHSAAQVYKIIESYHDQTSYTYFLLDDFTKNVVGEINLISPKGLSKLYPSFSNDEILFQCVDLSKSWIIEFYLDKSYWGKGLIPYFSSKLIEELKVEGAKSILAFTEHENTNSIRVLDKIGFTPIHENLGGDYAVMVKHL